MIADAKHKVESGTEVARGCGDALEKILGSVKNVDQLVTEIAHASKEQATGMNEITRAMAEFNKAMSQNSSVSQQCASASQPSESNPDGEGPSRTGEPSLESRRGLGPSCGERSSLRRRVRGAA